MQINFSRKFAKQYEKTTPKIRLAFDKRLKIFSKNPRDPSLNNHPLKGRLKRFRSINVTGDWRALYIKHNSYIIFEALGTHSQLYK